MSLSVKNLVKEYSTRTEPLRVLRGIDLELEPGANVAVVGPSGSGKSTLLSVIGALEPPTDGSVVLDDQDPYSLPAAALAEFRRRKVGFVFQDHHLLPQCSVLENVLLPTLAERADAEAVDRAHMLLERVGMQDRLEHRPSELSGGERQRAALCRALIFRPSMLLADEPTGNLDRTTAETVASLLINLQREEGGMLIVVTHSERFAQRLDRCLELDSGKLHPLESSRRAT